MKKDWDVVTNEHILAAIKKYLEDKDPYKKETGRCIASACRG